MVILTGPRQSGKTTLLRHVFGSGAAHVSLDAPDVRASALADPRSFLAAHRPPAIFDEVQQAPDLLPYIRAEVDAHRDQPGQFILSGSQNLLLMGSVSETPAGRAGVLRLLPLSLREAVGRPEAPLPWERTTSTASAAPTYGEVWRMVVRGLYPEPAARPTRNTERWHAAYTQTYIERDLRAVRQIADLSAFQVFLRALVARTAPKLYFVDTGTVCYLTGVATAEQAMHGPLAGALFETLVVGEALKASLHRGREPRMYYWRTADGAEVDLVLDQGDRLVPIDAKASATPRPAMASGIRRFRAAYGEAATAGFIVHPGDLTLLLGGETLAAPIGG